VPLHYQSVLGHEDAELDRLGDLFADLKQWRPEVSERTLALKARLAALVRDRPVAQAVLEQSIGLSMTTGGARRRDPTAILARRLFRRRRRRHQLPPLLQHQRSCRPAHGASAVFRTLTR